MKKVVLGLVAFGAISVAQAQTVQLPTDSGKVWLPMAFNECQRQVNDFQKFGRTIAGTSNVSQRVGSTTRIKYSPLLIQDSVVRFTCVENGQNGSGMHASKRTISDIITEVENRARQNSTSTMSTARALGLGE
jgi:hypothetical protein